ncbi:Secreted protein [Phytophthora palmivora]|uniref:Secreted protein n=1 Tax=Phytophthora palmivora TaxID=4796 RepID=A0A2P4Y541_9STRA|nr:Secreted protein [Phytophthora palmivora]
MISKIKSCGGSLSDEDLVAELLVNFELEALGNVAAIDENAKGQTAVISVSSQHMRKLYKRFPEILLADCTHKTNRYNYQLCTLMVMNQFGCGQAVQHSVIERNADWHMTKAIEQFQAVNDWKQTKVIMVDKDLNEIGVLRSMFPDVRILLCHFHVLKWLQGVVRDDKKYETYSSNVLKQLKQFDYCVHNMVMSKSMDALQNHADEFKLLVCRDGRSTLWTYFESNWMECKEVWVTCFRMDLPHFKNNTNNRLENFFGNLKANLESSMSMRQCLEAT